jgi:hypothetical protein
MTDVLSKGLVTIFCLFSLYCNIQNTHTHTHVHIYIYIYYEWGTRYHSGSRTMLQAGRSRVLVLMSLIYLFLLAVLGFWVYSASNRSKQKCFWGVKRGQHVKSATSPSANRLSRQCGIPNISQPHRPPRPVTGIALLYGEEVCFLWGTNWTVSIATSSQYLAVNCEPIV